MTLYSSWAANIGTGTVGFLANRPSSQVQGFFNETYDGPKVALVVGVTGIVGTSLANLLTRSDAPGGAWKVYGVARRRQPKWFEDFPVQYVECDVLNEADVVKKISPLKDVTHLFWVVWVSRNSEEENCADNGKMLQNVVNVLLPNAPKLEHICLQTGGKHYRGPFSSFPEKITVHEPPFREDMPRLPVINFYYTLEDIVFETVKKKEGLTWSVHRPLAILGFSPWALMNLLGTIAVYAAICKQEGVPFLYPGNKVTWEQFGALSDAELIAEQEIWASIDPKAKNQAYNVANGDVVSYKQIWTIVGRSFDLPVPPYDGQPRSLEQMMKGKEAVWDKIVSEQGLSPTKLAEVGTWWFADIILNLPVAVVSNMSKSKALGFWSHRDTEASIVYWLGKMRDKKIIP